VHIAEWSDETAVKHQDHILRSIIIRELHWIPLEIIQLKIWSSCVYLNLGHFFYFEIRMYASTGSDDKFNTEGR